MSGHHPFQRLVEDLPIERQLAIEHKKKELLAAIELREAIASTAPNWCIDTAATPLENVDLCLSYLHQAVSNLGGELTITAKFPDMVEVSILQGKSFCVGDNLPLGTGRSTNANDSFDSIMPET